MVTVLLLTPDPRRRELLSQPLREAGFAIASLSEAAHLAALNLEDTPDLLVLDTPSMPADDAKEAVEQCRGLHLPVLAVLDEGDAPRYRFSEGADDFLLEPVRPAELVLRVRQLLWRARGRDSQEVIRIGDLVIDQGKYEVNVEGRRALLTFKEYELLRLLASNPGQVFTREALLSRVWGYDYFGGTRTVDVHIRRLRSKIEDAHHTFIETVWNVGYRFKEPANGKASGIPSSPPA
ncbi:MAG: response regulator transcription factor [Chloroflexi bacterium]|nr:response regulator transcription factor [Chloroflexota bacterium]